MIPQQPGIKEGVFEIPKFNVNPEEVEDFAEELQAFMKPSTTAFTGANRGATSSSGT